MVIILYNSNSIAIIFISLTFHESSRKQEKEAGFSINFCLGQKIWRFMKTNLHRPINILQLLTRGKIYCLP